MASFQEHIKQSKGNLRFLGNVNTQIKNTWDWQVTVVSYAAVHMVNARIADKANLHYRSHEAVKNAISPENNLSTCVIPEEYYKAYVKLEMLSRRSRYLCNDNREDDTVSFTYDKHFAKALLNLDKIMTYMSKEYSIAFDELTIDCIEMQNRTYTYFKRPQLTNV